MNAEVNLATEAHDTGAEVSEVAKVQGTLQMAEDFTAVDRNPLHMRQAHTETCKSVDECENQDTCFGILPVEQNNQSLDSSVAAIFT